MLEARNLTKDFAAVRAVANVSFTVDKGESVGFLGPNGAGKTTTFRMLAGTLGPTSGRVLVHGRDLAIDPIEAKRQIGYMPEIAPLYPEMTVKEYLSYRAELRAIRHRERLEAIERAAQLAHVSDHLGIVIGHLSKGYRRRVALADALVGQPPILLLDEPTAGLDPNQVFAFRELIRSLTKEHAIVVSTHVLSEVEATCSRAIVIDRGRLVAQGSLDELGAMRARRRARVVLLTWSSELRKRLATELLDQDVSFEERGHSLDVCFVIADEHSLSRVIETCVRGGGVVAEAAPERAALDEVFATLTQKPDSRAE